MEDCEHTILDLLREAIARLIFCWPSFDSLLFECEVVCCASENAKKGLVEPPESVQGFQFRREKPNRMDPGGISTPFLTPTCLLFSNILEYK